MLYIMSVANYRIMTQRSSHRPTAKFSNCTLSQNSDKQKNSGMIDIDRNTHQRPI